MYNQIHLVSAGPADVLAAGDASAIIQAFRRYMEGWRLRATYLSEQLALHPPGSDAYDLAETRLAELQREIAVNRDDLVAETGLGPSDDLIDATLDELDELVASFSGATARGS